MSRGACLALAATFVVAFAMPGDARAQGASGQGASPARGVSIPESAAPQPTTPALPAPLAQAPAAPPPGLPPVMPFDQAVRFAADALLAKAALERGTGAPHGLVIDPLIDGNTGVQSAATELMGSRLTEIIRTAYASTYELHPFSSASLARGPLLLIGTFTAVDRDMKNQGDREIFRVCLALADMRTGRLVSKGFARSSTAGVDITPVAAFLESPAWAPDNAVDGYVRTCQGTKSGDAINPAYYDKVVVSAMIHDAINAYNAGRFEDALHLYRGILRMDGGDQLRVHNGIYLAAWRLGRKDEAVEAFGKVVDFGLRQKRLGVKFLFQPGSTQFWNDPYVNVAYPIWMEQIARQAAARKVCVEVSGHTSRTGSRALNDRLSRLRAEYIGVQLEREVPGLAGRLKPVGKSWDENLVGLGSDDAKDALDRRVEFKVIDC